MYKGPKKISYVCHCCFRVNIDIVHAIAGLMALFCKQSETRKIAIDPILKVHNLIGNFSLYYGEYREPATEGIWLASVPCSLTVAAYSPYSYWSDVMVDPRLLRASPAATLSQPATQQKMVLVPGHINTDLHYALYNLLSCLFQSQSKLPKHFYLVYSIFNCFAEKGMLKTINKKQKF